MTIENQNRLVCRLTYSMAHFEHDADIRGQLTELGYTIIGSGSDGSQRELDFLIAEAIADQELQLVNTIMEIYGGKAEIIPDYR